MTRILFALLLSLLVGVGTVDAKMVAVSTDQAEIRSSPSLEKSFVTMIAPRFYPLSIHEMQDDFFKVSDYLNNIGWIMKTLVSETRTVIVNTKTINVFEGPGANHPIRFTAQDGVALKVIGEEGNWLQVEHEDGLTGWLNRDLVWGD